MARSPRVRLELLPEQARTAARRAEAEIQSGRHRGPLYGSPVGLKDLFNTGGVRTTSGSRILDNFVPKEDCTVATRLQRAGAILLGKLNMHQSAYGPTGENPDYGHIHNPWDPDRIAGGSSGGSGSAAAAGQCPITLPASHPLAPAAPAHLRHYRVTGYLLPSSDPHRSWLASPRERRPRLVARQGAAATWPFGQKKPSAHRRRSKFTGDDLRRPCRRMRGPHSVSTAGRATSAN